MQRFWDKVDVRGPDECWPWVAWVDKDNYGRFGINSRVHVRVHRFAYELQVGPIPDGMEIDHTCHNEAAHAGECEGGRTCPHRRCCNPAHLDPATRRTNTLRSPHTVTGRKAAQTHCIHGHEFTPENTGRQSSGARLCRECARATARAYQARCRAKAKAA